MPKPVTQAVHCPACRALRQARRVGATTVDGRKVTLVRCTDRACELIWAARGRTS